MKIDIYEQTQIAIRKYGQNGDNSFECVGWSQSKKEITEYKIYRYFSKEQEHKSVIECTPELKPILERMIDIQKGTCMQLFDVSTRRNDRETTLSVVYQMKRNCLECEQEEAVEKSLSLFQDVEMRTLIYKIHSIIKPVLSPKNNPLTQLGVEITKHGEVIAGKMYFLLKDYTCNTWNPLYPKKEKVLFVIEEIFRNLSIDMRYLNDVCGYLDIFEKYNYCPFLLGINYSHTSIEVKLYFILNVEKLGNNYIDLLEKMLRESKIGETIFWTSHDKLVELDSLGLYMKGMAFCVSNKRKDELWKIYYMPKHN